VNGETTVEMHGNSPTNLKLNLHMLWQAHFWVDIQKNQEQGPEETDAHIFSNILCQHPGVTATQVSTGGQAGK
jgi:hypothetical protein